MRLAWLFLFLIVLGSSQTGCGGGSQSAAMPNSEQPLSADVMVSPTVKVLAGSDSQLVTLRPDGSIAVASSLSPKPGDLFIVNGQGLKLGNEILIPGNLSIKYFLNEIPALNELYEKLEITGTVSQSTVGQASAMKHASAWGFGESTCLLGNGLGDGYWSVQCDVKVKDPQYEAPSVTGNLTIGLKASFNKYSLLTNSGSARIGFNIGGKAALAVSRTEGFGTYSATAKDDSCTSALLLTGRLSQGRILLAAPSIPIGVTGLELNIPICVAVGVKAGVAGELISLSGSERFDLLLGDGKPPRLEAPIGNLGSAKVPSDSAVWSMDPVNSNIDSLNITGSGELGFEVGLELSAARIYFTGLSSRLIGQAGLSANFAAAMLGADSVFGDLRASSKACGVLELGGSFQLDYFSKIPAFLKFSPLQKRTAISDIRLETLRENFGLCGKTSAAASVNMVDSSMVAGLPISVTTTVASAPAIDEILWGNRPSGIVEIMDADTESRLCLVSIDSSGTSSCSVSGFMVGAHRIYAKYAGDSRYKPTKSPLIEFTVQEESKQPVVTIVGEVNNFGNGAILSASYLCSPSCEGVRAIYAVFECLYTLSEGGRVTVRDVKTLFAFSSLNSQGYEPPVYQGSSGRLMTVYANNYSYNTQIYVPGTGNGLEMRCSGGGDSYVSYYSNGNTESYYPVFKIR